MFWLFLYTYDFFDDIVIYFYVFNQEVASRVMNCKDIRIDTGLNNIYITILEPLKYMHEIPTYKSTQIKRERGGKPRSRTLSDPKAGDPGVNYHRCGKEW